MTTEAVDLLASASNDTAVLEILKPNGLDSTGWRVTFAGPAHAKAIAWQNEETRKNLRRQQRIEQAQVNGKKYKPEDRDPDDVRHDNVAWIVSRIIDWTPVRLGPGEPIVFSEASATELLLNPKLGWVFTQMVDFLADERSFTKASAKI